jgi:hypothetical protein
MAAYMAVDIIIIDDFVSRGSRNQPRPAVDA